MSGGDRPYGETNAKHIKEIHYITTRTKTAGNVMCGHVRPYGETHWR